MKTKPEGSALSIRRHRERRQRTGVEVIFIFSLSVTLERNKLVRISVIFSA